MVVKNSDESHGGPMGVSSHPGETALKATPVAKIYDRRKAKLPRAGLGDFVETSNGLAILVPKEILLHKKNGCTAD